MSEAHAAMTWYRNADRWGAPIVGAVIALMLAALPQAAQAACPGPADALGAVVCRDAGLTEAWTDIGAKLTEITSAHPELSTALAEDQQLFIALLNKTLKDLLAEHTTDAVPAILLSGLEDRLAFLSAISPSAATGLVGAWQNAGGGLRITAGGGDHAKLTMSVSEPIMGLNTCSIEGEGRDSAGLLIVELPPSDEASLALIGQSGLLGLDYTRAGRAVQGPLRCSDSPPVSGWYFRVNQGA